MKIILKSPTTDDLQWSATKRGCLFPSNQGSLFLAHELEGISKQHQLITDADITRKKEIESLLKFGFFVDENISTYISESILTDCYHIINSGICCTDLEKSLICYTNDTSGLRQNEQDLIEEIRVIKSKMLYLYEYSQDAFLERMYNYCLMIRCVLKQDLSPVFSTLEDIFNSDPYVISLMFRRFTEFRNYIPESVFRAIARGEGESGKNWNNIWYSMKSIGSSPYATLDENKMSLCRWTERYDNIRSMHDAPSDDILSNDAALDNWLFNKKIERNNPQNSPSDMMVMNSQNQEKSFIAPNAMTFEVGDENG